jgi:hypothetical protein
MDAFIFQRPLLRAFFFLGMSALGLLPCVIGHGGTIDPHTPDAKYLEFGKKFPCVVRLRAESDAIIVIKPKEGRLEKVTQWGSAVVIKPHWVLTAAHVVVNARNHHAVTDSAAEHPLNPVIIHPEFNDDKYGYADLALCYSPTGFDLPFYCEIYTDDDELHKPVTIAGYGITGTFFTGAKVSDGKKRAGHNRVESLERAVLVCTPSRTNRFPLEFCITPGDSGGGLFIGDKLAGINSFLMAADGNPNGTYGDEGAHIRLSLYADWIAKEIAAYEALLPPAKITDNVVPEPQPPQPKKPLPPLHRDEHGRPIPGPVHIPDNPSTKPWWERR